MQSGQRIKLLAAAFLLASGAVVLAQDEIAIRLTPSSASLSAGQSAKFEATVTGTNLPYVTWMMPSVGRLDSGLYTAPATISAPQAVTIVARSLADETKTASATIFLLSTVSVAVTPASVSLAPGQSVAFLPSIAGTFNTSVSWALNPPVGTIANGVYTAPATVSTLQTILLTLTSLADPSKTAQASITLTPSLPTSISISPSETTLEPSGTKQFMATIEGGTGSVVWSINPGVGSISPSGLYTAPSSLSVRQSVTVTASTLNKTASAIITLAGPTPPPPVPPIQLPLEVVGLDGTIVTTPFSIPAGSNLTGALTLSMQIHGLRYGTQASVQVNASGWNPISDTTVTLLGNATAYGGIGGGFSTLKMTMSLPAGVATVGTNTISFRFNGTDGRVSGFRVLAFNLVNASGSSLIPAQAFVQEDPNTWQPPSSQASDIATGKTLWYTASLTKPTTSGPTPIQAHCTDCHAQDGRDLKYFNYSNNSVRTRAMFHGLTAEQGNQIASYIRTLNVVNPGRPWNPPYQPGPGLDSGPVIDWAAGAGLDAVLDNDQEMMNGLFPSGIQNSTFSASGNLNIRETQIAFQLPDWNQWLPGTHPIDAFGTAFTSSPYNTVYSTLRANLRLLDPVAYTGQASNFSAWFGGYYTLEQLEGPAIWNSSTGYTPPTIDAMYSLTQWGMVKNWEMMNEFQLEGFAQSIFASTAADQRAWYSQQPFMTSPHELHMPPGAVGLRNGTSAVYTYLAYIWYHLQLILNNSNKQQHDHQPIDWGYSYGFVGGISELVQPQAALQIMWMIKGLQISNNGVGPQLGQEGWQPVVNDIGLLTAPQANRFEWLGVNSSTRASVVNGMLTAWLAQVTQFTPQQFYTGAWASPTVNPVPLGSYTGAFGDWVWYMIPRFKFMGADPTLVGQVAQWAQTVWPNANWTAVLNATCYAPNMSYDGVVDCSQ